MQKAVGYLLPSPTHPTQGHPDSPLLTLLGLRVLTSPGQAPPSINSLLHCCLALAALIPQSPSPAWENCPSLQLLLLGHLRCPSTLWKSALSLVFLFEGLALVS